MVALFLLVQQHGSLTSPAVHFEPGHFAIAPYLQLGRTGKLGDIEVCWGTSEYKSKWELQTRIANSPWVSGGDVQQERINVEGVQPFTMYHAPIRELIPAGTKWSYRLLEDGKPIFDTEAMPFHSGLQKWRFAVIGDCGAGTIAQRAVASALHKSCKPDVLLIAGDIVYQNGRLGEYLRRFFPVYNADSAGSQGVPMMRSTLFVAAPGNHDTAHGSLSDGSDLNLFPDGLAYYALWKQPLNGPELAKQPGVNIPNVRGAAAHVDSFFRAAGASFPRMGNFSYDYGNAHFTVLDANLYMNWQDPHLRSWLENDLNNARLATWRFVVFHQPPFNADAHHQNEQQMRLVADIFQRNKVDVVFSGHVHNYQRTRPLSFKVRPQANGSPIARNHIVDGKITVDDIYDGEKDKTPEGVIYVITGCGGATLVEGDLPQKYEAAKEFSVKVLPLYSYTQCDLNGRQLVVQQIDPTGKVLDRFEITK